MAKAKNKTVENEGDVNEFLNALSSEEKKADSQWLLNLFSSITGMPPRMWGSSIVGFGSYHYKYKTGREGDMLITGFSPRKQNFSLYIMDGFPKYAELMSKLGKYKTGKSCLYFKKRKDVDEEVLSQLIRNSFEYVKTKYSAN